MLRCSYRLHCRRWLSRRKPSRSCLSRRSCPWRQTFRRLRCRRRTVHRKKLSISCLQKRLPSSRRRSSLHLLLSKSGRLCWSYWWYCPHTLRCSSRLHCRHWPLLRKPSRFYLFRRSCPWRRRFRRLRCHRRTVHRQRLSISCLQKLLPSSHRRSSLRFPPSALYQLLLCHRFPLPQCCSFLHLFRSIRQYQSYKLPTCCR